MVQQSTVRISRATSCRTHVTEILLRPAKALMMLGETIPMKRFELWSVAVHCAA
jgi:hypothetical protein